MYIREPLFFIIKNLLEVYLGILWRSSWAMGGHASALNCTVCASLVAFVQNMDIHTSRRCAPLMPK